MAAGAELLHVSERPVSALEALPFRVLLCVPVLMSVALLLCSYAVRSWYFNPSNFAWTWMAGVQTLPVAIYGAYRVPNVNNAIPGKGNHGAGIDLRNNIIYFYGGAASCDVW
jgi:hypothetical protein